MRFIKLLSISFILIGFFIGNKMVKAETLSFEYADFYYERKSLGGEYNSWMFPKYTMDGKRAYCIQFEVQQGVNYNIADWKDIGISDEKKEKILLTAYYGYNYPNHQTDYYLAATQALLWELTADDDVTVTFNTKRYGAGSNVDVSKEKKEIEELVKHHFDKPNIDSKYILRGSEKIELSDALLSNYDLVSSDNLNVIKENDKITIMSGSKAGDYVIRLVRKQYYSDTYFVLTSPNYQNMLVAGNLEPTYLDINIKVSGGTLVVNKKDMSSKKDLLKSGIKFKLKDVSGNYVCNDSCVYETTSKGRVYISNLALGTYTLEEVDQYIDGYLWNNRTSQIYMNSDNTTVYFYNQPVTGKINVTKFGEKLINDGDKISYDKVPLEGVEFVLKAKDNIFSNNVLVYSKDQIVKTLVTDENGKLIIDNLPLGKYYLYESKSNTNYILNQDIYEISFDYVDQYTGKIEWNKEIYNYILKGSIEIYKKDSYTGKPISNVLFELYKDDKFITNFKTDDLGVARINNLAYGNYEVKEANIPINGYLWNKEVLHIDLQEKVFKTDYYNDPVFGEINIFKHGEKMVSDGVNISYKDIVLPGVKFVLKARENIIYNNEIIYYKDDIIDTYETDNDGKINISQLPLGNYYLEEVNSNLNHLLDKKILEINLNYVNQYIKIVGYNKTLYNYLPKGSFLLNKKDLVNGGPISDVAFELYKDDQLLITFKTDSTGAALIDNLEYGKYYVKEVDSPLNGYLWNDNVLEINIDDNIITKDFYNKPVYGEINITKYGEKMTFNDLAINYKKVVLPNISFVLKAYEDIYYNKEIKYYKDDIVGVYTTDDNGCIKISDLVLGNYYLQELNSLDNYIVNDEIINVNLEYIDQYTDVVQYKKDIYNFLYKGNIKIQKRDVDTLIPLSNVLFGLYKENHLLSECYTDINGECVFTNLAYDNYLVKELKPIEDYKENNELYEVSLFEETKNLDIFNKKNDLLEEIFLDVPNTGSYNYGLVLLLILLFMIKWLYRGFKNGIRKFCFRKI